MRKAETVQNITEQSNLLYCILTLQHQVPLCDGVLASVSLTTLLITELHSYFEIHQVPLCRGVLASVSSTTLLITEQNNLWLQSYFEIHNVPLCGWVLASVSLTTL